MSEQKTRGNIYDKENVQLFYNALEGKERKELKFIVYCCFQDWWLQFLLHPVFTKPDRKCLSTIPISSRKTTKKLSIFLLADASNLRKNFSVRNQMLFTRNKNQLIMILFISFLGISAAGSAQRILSLEPSSSFSHKIPLDFKAAN